MKLREFFDHLGIVLLVVTLTAIVVWFMLFYKHEAKQGAPALFEDEQWGDEWR